MFIDKNSFYLEDINLGSYVTDIQYQYEKMWGDDTGRNLAGSFNGTLNGIYPKFIVRFGYLTKQQLETIIPILDSREQNITYYDPNKKETIVKKTYSGSYTLKYSNVDVCDPFEISFISEEKRL